MLSISNITNSALQFNNIKIDNAKNMTSENTMCSGLLLITVKPSQERSPSKYKSKTNAKTSKRQMHLKWTWLKQSESNYHEDLLPNNAPSSVPSHSDPETTRQHDAVQEVSDVFHLVMLVTVQLCHAVMHLV